MPFTGLRIDKDVPVPMRDGTILATDVYRPDNDATAPVLVQRHPYGKELSAANNYAIDLLRAVRHGYAVVNQDVRGRFASGGAFYPFAHEARDGFDTVAWAAAQPWSEPRVGMIGGSYFGATQLLAATQRPPALRAIAPCMAPWDQYAGWVYQGGAFSLGLNLHWTLTRLAVAEVRRRVEAGQASFEELDQLIAVADRNDALYWRRPLRNLPELTEAAPYYLDWLDHPSLDSYWRAMSPAHTSAPPAIPTLVLSGWYDPFLSGSLDTYLHARSQLPPTPHDADRSLIIGPWAHASLAGEFPERRYGLRASADAFDVTAAQLDWFDRYLRDEPRSAPSKQVHLFVTGPDEWRAYEEWPVPGTELTRYYLRSEGRANTLDGDGWLSTSAPAEEPEDVFLYEPWHPAPTLGGRTLLPGLSVAANAGPRDQRPVEQRDDVLCYTTGALDRTLEIIGPIRLVLFVSSSAPDTDFTGKLVDVHPDGRAELLTEGVLRARWRESFSSSRALKSGSIHELHLDLGGIATALFAGHRLRLEVSSSNFPRHDANSNTGGTIAEEGYEHLVPALNRIHHRAGHPSHLLLPLLEK